MADIFEKIKQANSIKNGGSVVFYNELTPPTGVPPKVNTSHVVTQSGVLDTRFDDARYYSGDTTA